MRTLLLLGSLLMLSACNHTPNNNVLTVGPRTVHCPEEHFGQSFRKSGLPLDYFASCYWGDVQTVDARGLVLSKAHWLNLKSGPAEADAFLQEAIAILGSRPELHLARVEFLITMREWGIAQQQLDLAEVKPNHYLRLWVEPRTGRYSPDTDLSKLAAVYQYQLQNEVAPRAQITTSGFGGFDLKRIDNANPGILGGETSFKVSANGQNLWLTWTDSSASFNDENRWRLRSARSTDGGNSWINESFSPNPHIQDIFHFDPMTAYDAHNNILYAGGMTISFTDSARNSFYFYEWDINNNSINGPFQHFVQSLDKGWATVDNNGRLWFTENRNTPRFSDDGGRNFNSAVIQGGSSAFTPQPRVDANNCVHIMDISAYYRCDGQGSFNLIRNTALSSIPGFLMGFDIPGTFRALPLTLMAIHPNGDLYTVYPDYDTPDSGDIALWMTRSQDNGNTWQAPWIVSPNVSGDRFLPWIEIDPQGGIHLMYMDTRHSILPDNSPEAELDIYYSYSQNGGQNWQESRVTPISMDVPELIWGDYFLSDYIEMTVANNAVFLSFPWSNTSGDMDVYVARRFLGDDLIFENDFE